MRVTPRTLPRPKILSIQPILSIRVGFGSPSPSMGEVRGEGATPALQRPTTIQYSSIMRCNSEGSEVRVKPSISRIRAFLGCRLSATM